MYDIQSGMLPFCGRERAGLKHTSNSDHPDHDVGEGTDPDDGHHEGQEVEA